MISAKMSQMEMISIEDMVPTNHRYRQYLKLFDFEKIEYRLKKLESKIGRTGYGLVCLFRCLLLQYMEDLSDRQLEEFLQSNNIGKWFCGFSLSERTPDHSLFSVVRKRIGTNKLAKLFNLMRDQFIEKGYIREIFSFVDASHLITKNNLWEERDEAIKKNYDKLNNEILPKIARDDQARIGCKGKKKFWYGFKKHVCVDMQSGLINKVAVTPANITDDDGFKHVCPKQGATYIDKGYNGPRTRAAAAKNNVHLALIKKNNMKDKNRDQDRWYSKIRAPYERVFSKQNKRVRYLGVSKNQFAEFMNAFCFNIHRLVAINNDNCLS